MFFQSGYKGKGVFYCVACKNPQETRSEKSTLKDCKCCGSKVFYLRLQRSEASYKEKLDEALTVMEISIFLSKFLNLNEFIYVIATQLRIILCQPDLLSKVIENPQFFPCKKEYLKAGDTDILLEFNLFDKSATKIPLMQWLEQEIIIGEIFKPVTIQRLIKIWAEKNGGAHVDASLVEEEALVIRGLDKHIFSIALEVLDICNRNLSIDISDKFIKPFKDKGYTFTYKEIVS